MCVNIVWHGYVLMATCGKKKKKIAHNVVFEVSGCRKETYTLITEYFYSDKCGEEKQHQKTDGLCR